MLAAGARRPPRVRGDRRILPQLRQATSFLCRELSVWSFCSYFAVFGPILQNSPAGLITATVFKDWEPNSARTDD